MNTKQYADFYQEFFDFLNQEHNIICTIDQMDEIRNEVHKLENKIKKSKLTQKKDNAKV